MAEKSGAALHTERERPRQGSQTEIREVQNVALADATAKGAVSPWTRSMGKVCLRRPFFLDFQFDIPHFHFRCPFRYISYGQSLYT